MIQPPEVRQAGAAVPMRGYRICQAVPDEVYNLLVDFYSPVARADLLLWTNGTDRVRVNVGGGWLTVGHSRATAASLGAFTAGQVKAASLEVKVPAAAGSRQEELPLCLGWGLDA